MTVEKTPFTRYHLGDKPKLDSFTVRLNIEERQNLDLAKKIIEQPKDSTALKTLAWLGAKVLHEPQTRYLLALVFSNKRKNNRLGVVDFE